MLLQRHNPSLKHSNTLLTTGKISSKEEKMDVSAFEAVSGEEHPQSMSELAAFFDEDLRLPVAGAVAIVKHLLHLALLVWTLAACVFLYCFALAWLCLFWFQTRLFKYTSALLNRCMSTATVNEDLKIDRPSTQKAKVTETSKIADSERLLAALSHSGPVAGASRSLLTTSAKETHRKIDADEAIIFQEILQREKELEAEIQELVASHGTELGCTQSLSPTRLISNAEGSSVDPNGHAADNKKGEDIGRFHEEDSMSDSKFILELFAVETAATTHSPQSQQPNEPTSKHHTNAEPAEVATFKLRKSKVTKRPRVDDAEQVNARKAREQTIFINALTANSIVSTKQDDFQSCPNQAEHLQSVWNGESVITPTRSRPHTAITKTSPSLAASRSTPVSKRSLGQQTRRAVEPVPRSDQNSLTIPPQLRSALDAKAKRAAADQLGYEADVEAKANVSIENPFANFADSIFSDNKPHSCQVKNEHVSHHEQNGARVSPALDSPSPPEPVEQRLNPEPVKHATPEDEVDFKNIPRNAQPYSRADAVVDMRRVYTMDALKATNNAPIKVHREDFAGRIEAAAELVAFYTQSGQEPKSPKQKLGTSGWDNFDCTKKRSPANDTNTTPIVAAGKPKAIPQPPGFSPKLQERHASAASITTKTNLLEISVQKLAKPAHDAQVTSEAALPNPISSASNFDLAGLEFGDPSSLGQPTPKSIPPEPSRSLPITPGPLSFFVPKVLAKDNYALQPTTTSSLEWRLDQDPIAFSPFAPGPFMSNGYDNGSTPQHYQSQEFQWMAPDPYASQEYFHAPRPMAPQIDPYSSTAFNFAFNDTGVIDYRRPSLAVPIRVPSFDLSSEGVFPTLGAAKSTHHKIAGSTPPGPAVARSDTHAEFDSLLSPTEAPPERAPNLSKFISTATRSPARLDRTHGQAANETGSAVTAIRTYVEPLPATFENSTAAMKLPLTHYDATFPELPKVISLDVPVDGGSNDKNMKREKKRNARESLKLAWFDREDARKQLVGSFSLEGANKLKQKTLLYLEKRSALQSLMVSSTLNQQDASMFPEFGLMDLSVPKVKVAGIEEWRSRKRESKVDVAQAIDAAPVAPVEQADDIDPIIRDLIVAVRHREQSQDQLKMPRPQSNMAYNTWVTTCKQTCARADRLYNRKRKILVEAFPEGLPTELEMRFPDISMRG